jgi:hypothetical protein
MSPCEEIFSGLFNCSRKSRKLGCTIILILMNLLSKSARTIAPWTIHAPRVYGTAATASSPVCKYQMIVSSVPFCTCRIFLSKSDRHRYRPVHEFPGIATDREPNAATRGTNVVATG